jgi:tetratricopeptide (TPR) repeat protein
MSDSISSSGERVAPDLNISSTHGSPKHGAFAGLIIGLFISSYIVVGFLGFFWEMSILGIVVCIAVYTLFLYGCWWCWIGWNLVFRFGILTWLRLAKRPAKLIARGDMDGAERTLHRAIQRATRFSVKDPRRALMLCELARYLKNQGRYSEAMVFLEESVGILSQSSKIHVTEYFNSLIVHAGCYLDLREYSAAQRILEKAIDLTLFARKGDESSFFVIPMQQIREIELVLHMNLVSLLVGMDELAEAKLHLNEVDSLWRVVTKRRRSSYHESYVILHSQLQYKAGNLAEARSELEKGHKPDSVRSLAIRAKLCLTANEHFQAEQLLRKYQDQERRKGTLHRPDLLDGTLDLAEALFGQAKHDVAFASLQEARSIVADFALPADAAWRKTLETWLQRARELGKPEVVASLEADLQRMPATANQAVTILEKFRIHPQAAE